MESELITKNEVIRQMIDSNLLRGKGFKLVIDENDDSVKISRDQTDLPTSRVLNDIKKGCSEVIEHLNASLNTSK